jgi:hypothetical protein
VKNIVSSISVASATEPNMNGGNAFCGASDPQKINIFLVAISYPSSLGFSVKSAKHRQLEHTTFQIPVVL